MNKSAVKVAVLLLIAILYVSVTACSDTEKPLDKSDTIDQTITEAIDTTPQTTAKQNRPATENPAKIKVPEANENTNLEKTAPPKITATVYPGKTLACISGYCDEESIIIIRGAIADTAFRADKTNFIGTAEIENSGSTTLYVSAKAEGKSESESVEITVKPSSSNQIREDDFEVIVGLDSQCHFVSALPDYIGSNLLKDSQVKSLTSRIEKRIQYLKSAKPETELIYLVIPNSMSVYPETVPDKYVKNNGITRKDQFVEAVREGGATVIDATEAIISHKEDELKLFHKTDSHWTEYGAWIAYSELMDYISESFPQAKPRSFTEMSFYEKMMAGGDMPYYLAIDGNNLKELAVRAKLSVESVPYTLKFASDDDLLMNHNTTPKAATITTKRPELPSAYIMRDSYGIALYDMLAERFDTTIYETMWVYDFNTTNIAKLDVDYIIYVIAERNLANVIY